jgi:hypothetical protein
MLDFYGFQGVPSGESIEVLAVPNFPQASRHWFIRFDHNHLRITRIIRSLRILGLEQNGVAFFHALSRVNNQFKGRLSTRSVEYWRRAALRPLHIAPDVDDDDSTTGEQFLVDFEASRAIDLGSEPTKNRNEVSETAGENSDSGKRIEQVAGELTEEETSNGISCPVPE